MKLWPPGTGIDLSLIEQLQIRVFGDSTLPVLVYLPGLHGDWTLVTSFRMALKDRVRFVEITYPRSLTWTMANYADAIESALLSHGIRRGWVLGESFGSQPAWKLVETSRRSEDCGPAGAEKGRFSVAGLILAGGFVKHPLKHGPGILRWIGQKTPMQPYRKLLGIYGWFARFRHRHAPETLANISEFIARRTLLDREAMRHRLALLDQVQTHVQSRGKPASRFIFWVDWLIHWCLDHGCALGCARTVPVTVVDARYGSRTTMCLPRRRSNRQASRWSGFWKMKNNSPSFQAAESVA